MNRAVVIATTPGRQDRLNNILESFGGYDHYKLLVVSDYGYEVGKIRFIRDHTDIDEFVLLHDSCYVKDPSFIDQAFDYPHSVAFTDHPVLFGCYMGKYKRGILNQIDIPTITTKTESVEQEVLFNCAYVAKDMNTKLLFKDFGNTDVFEQKWGKEMMRIENHYLIKWKSTWNRNQLDPPQ